MLDQTFYDSGAAIGSKKSSFNSDIVINGGNITAKSSEGATIGCGEYPDTKIKSDGTVTVNGGNIGQHQEVLQMA